MHKQVNTIPSGLPYVGYLVWFVYSSVTLLDLAFVWILHGLEFKSRIERNRNCVV